ncbi:MAG: glutamine synthetase family protein [Paracoccaceae bacterium]
MSEDASQWLKDHPDLASVRAAVVDLNGVWRGKRLPVAQAEKLLSEGARMPLSITTVDIWGTDTQNNPLVFDTGDGDGFARPTGRGILPMDWLAHPTAMVPLWMSLEDGSPSPVDPRQVLARVIDRYRAAGLKCVTAMELEFYITDPAQNRPNAPISPLTQRRLDGDGVLSIDEIDQFEGFFGDVYAACDAHGVAVDAAISENGAGQFEVNLMHCDDPLKIADDATFFKRFVKGIARKHGFAGTFMAKPYQDRAGSGLHVHFSILDKDGNNIFDNGSDEGSPVLGHAVNGLLQGMSESTLVFAPHLNSYRRMAPGTHAPTGICWGYENRTAAIRIPGGPAKARRIEHRVAGADANPYLVMAAVLGAALTGIEVGQNPVNPISGDAYGMNLAQLPSDWGQAINLFENGETNATIYPDLMRKVYVLAKQQELQKFTSRMSDFEIATYLETV